MLVDIEDPRIERDIGDREGLKPHFVVDDERWAEGNTVGVLYWPNPNREPSRPGLVRSSWLARAFKSPDAAAQFLAHRFGP